MKYAYWSIGFVLLPIYIPSYIIAMVCFVLKSVLEFSSGTKYICKIFLYVGQPFYMLAFYSGIFWYLGVVNTVKLSEKYVEVKYPEKKEFKTIYWTDIKEITCSFKPPVLLHIAVLNDGKKVRLDGVDINMLIEYANQKGINISAKRKVS